MEALRAIGVRLGTLAIGQSSLAILLPNSQKSGESPVWLVFLLMVHEESYIHVEIAHPL